MVSYEDDKDPHLLEELTRDYRHLRGNPNITFFTDFGI